MRQAFAANLLTAHKALEAKEGAWKVKPDEIARRVAEITGDKPPGYNTVRDWFAGALPPAHVGLALGMIYGTTFSALLAEGAHPAKPPQSAEDAPGKAMRRPGRYRDASAKDRPEQGKKTG